MLLGPQIGRCLCSGFMQGTACYFAEHLPLIKWLDAMQHKILIRSALVVIVDSIIPTLNMSTTSRTGKINPSQQLLFHKVLRNIVFISPLVGNLLCLISETGRNPLVNFGLYAL